MARSRSAREFLERHGLLLAEPAPAPRLSVDDLLVHQLPLPSPPLPTQQVLTGYEGLPPPDRGESHPWPRQT